VPRADDAKRQATILRLREEHGGLDDPALTGGTRHGHRPEDDRLIATRAEKQRAAVDAILPAQAGESPCLWNSARRGVRSA
jgi:hypothetical protein